MFRKQGYHAAPPRTVVQEMREPRELDFLLSIISSFWFGWRRGFYNKRVIVMAVSGWLVQCDRIKCLSAMPKLDQPLRLLSVVKII